MIIWFVRLPFWVIVWGSRLLISGNFMIWSWVNCLLCGFGLDTRSSFLGWLCFKLVYTGLDF